MPTNWHCRLFLIFVNHSTRRMSQRHGHTLTSPRSSRVLNQKNLDDLRPISLTSICSKILDKLVWDQVLVFLATNNVLSNAQHGSLPGRSVNSNLLSFTNALTRVYNDPELPGLDVIYIDFRKAFDSVPYQYRGSLGKFECVCIRGRLLNWLSSFLTGRKTTCGDERGYNSLERCGQWYTARNAVLTVLFPDLYQ